MMTRYLVSLALGVTVGFSLFGLMRQLVAGSDEAQVTATEVKFVDFVRVKREETLRTKDRELPDKPDPSKKPPPPQMAASQQQNQDIQAPELDINIPNIGGSFAGTGPYIGSPFSGNYNVSGDSEVIPLVQIEPQYPREALINCVAGVVNLEFTILEDGSVADPTVISSEPPRMFDRAATRAILRWKFKPRIVDGRPVQRRATLPLEFKKPQGC